MPEPTRTYYSQLLEAYAKLHGPVTLVFYLDRSHTTRLPHLGQDSQNEALGSSELRAAARVSSLPIIHPSHVHGIRCFQSAKHMEGPCQEKGFADQDPDLSRGSKWFAINCVVFRVDGQAS